MPSAQATDPWAVESIGETPPDSSDPWAVESINGETAAPPTPSPLKKIAAKAPSVLAPWLDPATASFRAIAQSPRGQKILQAEVTEPTKDLILGGKSGSAWMYHLAANSTDLLDRAASTISSLTGLKKGEAFAEATRALRGLSEAAAPTEEDLADRKRFTNKMYQAIGQLPGVVGTYAVAGSAVGPVAAFAIVDAIDKADQGWWETLKGGVKGLALGTVLKGAAPLKRSVRAPLVGATFGGEAAVAGAEPTDVAVSSLVGTAMGAMGGPGEVRLRDVPRDVLAAVRGPGPAATPPTATPVPRGTPPAKPPAPEKPPVAAQEALLETPRPAEPAPRGGATDPWEVVSVQEGVKAAPEPTMAQEYRKNALVLDQITADLKAGQPGGKTFIERPDQGPSEVKGYASTYPKYFQGKGYAAAETLKIIDRIRAGKQITERQRGIVEDLIAGKRAELLEQAQAVRSEQVRLRGTAFPFGEPSPPTPAAPPGVKQPELFRPEIPAARIPSRSELPRGAEAGLFEEGGAHAQARAEAEARARQGEIFGEGTVPSGAADVGGYAKRPRPDPGPERPRALESPELVELATELMQGKYPAVMKALRMAGAKGVFYGRGEGDIRIRADVAKSPEEAVKVLAHEIGHLIDYLPERTLSRGNILGRIASLKKYGKHLLEEYPGAPQGLLTVKDRARLRREAEQEVAREKAVQEGPGTLLERTVVESGVTITPQEIVDIWKTTEAREKNPTLYEFIARLTPAEKVAIVKQALKGMVAPEVQARFRVTADAIKKPFTDWDKRLRELYQKLLREEIIRRKLYDVETITKELKDLTHRWKPFNAETNPRYTKYRYQSKELYADALSVLFNDPAFLKERARTFYKGLMAYLERKPEVKAGYERIQARIAQGPEAVETARVEKLRQGMKRYDDAMFRNIEERRDLVERLKYDLMDVNEAILRRVRTVPGGESTIPPNANPRYFLEREAHTAAEAEGYLGQIKFKVMPILDRAKLTWNDLGEFMFHRRVMGERAEMFNPEGWTAELSSQRLESWRATIGPERFNALREAAEAFWRNRQPLIEKAIQARIFSPEAAPKLRENSEYGTFAVAEYIEAKYGKGSYARIFPQVGTLKSVGNVATATVVKDLAIMHAVNRAAAAHTTAEFLQHHFPADIRTAKTAWNGRAQMPVPTRESGWDTMTYLRDGKVQGYDVPKYVAKAFTRDYAESEFIVRLLSGLAQPFREIFVNKQPLFWMFNIPRDYFRSAINLPGANALKLTTYWLRGIKPGFRRAFAIPDDVIAEMLKGHELISVASHQFGGGRETPDLHIERLLAAYRLHPQRWENALTKPFMRFFEAVDRVGRAIDTIPKVAAHLYLKERFPRMDPEVRAHIVRSQVGTPDVIRRGYSTRWVNNLLLFSNPQIQGWRGDIEALQHRPSEVAWKRAKYTIIPKLLMFTAAAGYFGPQLAEWMDNVDPYDAANYTIIPLGQTPQGEVQYFRQPNDDVGRLIGGVVWKILNWKDENHPLPSVIDYAAGQAPGFNPGPYLLLATLDYMAGNNPYDRFRQRPALPDDVFDAHDWRTHKAFIKWLFSKSSGGWVKPPTGDEVEDIAHTELEKIIDVPIAGTIVGKFFKVSQRGVDEQYRKALERVRTDEARRRLDYRTVLQKFTMGEMLTPEDHLVLASRKELPMETIMRYGGKRYGNAFLRAMARANTNAEKLAVLETFNRMRLQYGDRKTPPMAWELQP